MTVDDEPQPGRQRRGHAPRGRAGQRARRADAFTTPPRSPSPAVTRACSARTCSTRARSSTTPTTGRSSRPRRSPAPRLRCPGASTARRSSSATPRPARWTRSTGPTTSSPRSRWLRHYLPGWFPLIGPELGYTNLVPVDFVADAMDHIAHQPGLDGQAFHLTNPRSPALGRRDQRLRRRRPRPAAVDADRHPPAPGAPQGHAGHADAAAGRQGRAPGDPRRLRYPRGGPRAHRPRPPSSTPATPSGRSRAPGSRSRRSSPTRPSCGTTGSATSIPTCSRTAASRAPSTARPC